MTSLMWNKIETELWFTFARSSGPGGQHVNTSDTQVHLHWDVSASAALSAEQAKKVSTHLKSYINKNQVVVIRANRYRSRQRNKEDASLRLKELLQEALKRVKKRVPTKPSRNAKKKRVDEKKRVGEQKKQRQRVKY